MKKEEVAEARIRGSYTPEGQISLVVGGGRRLTGGRPTIQFMLGLAIDLEPVVWFEGWRIRGGKVLPPTREVGIKSFNLAWVMSPRMFGVIGEMVREAYSRDPEFRGVEWPIYEEGDEG